jgi:hypothetical protein
VVDSSNNKEQKKSRLFSGECPPQIVDEMKIEQASGRVTRKKEGDHYPIIGRRVGVEMEH